MFSSFHDCTGCDTLANEVDRLKLKLKRQQEIHMTRIEEQEEEARLLWEELYEENRKLKQQIKRLQK
jgi:hypothetical protein